MIIGNKLNINKENTKKSTIDQPINYDLQLKLKDEEILSLKKTLFETQKQLKLYESTYDKNKQNLSSISIMDDYKDIGTEILSDSNLLPIKNDTNSGEDGQNKLENIINKQAEKIKLISKS